MPSGLMTGADIIQKWKDGKYPKGYVKRAGGYYKIRNSVGRWVVLHKGKLYYHRGKGRFADWGVSADSKRHAETVVTKRKFLNLGDMPHKTKVGKKRYWL